MIAPPQQGKSSFIFSMIPRLIDIKTNKECHIIVFSTSMDSEINKKKFDDIIEKTNCYTYLYEELPEYKTTD